MSSVLVATERRRFRRAELDVPVTLRPLLDGNEPGAPITGRLRDVSLAGLRCDIDASHAVKINDRLVCSLSIPRDYTRIFPFTRVHSKGWVLRVEPPAQGRSGAAGTEPVGLAIAFSPDTTALATFD